MLAAWRQHGLRPIEDEYSDTSGKLNSKRISTSKNPRGWSRSNAADLYSGGVRFEYRSGHLLHWLTFFVVFINPSGKYYDDTEYTEATWIF
jgi:hypothetical protein